MAKQTWLPQGLFHQFNIYPRRRKEANTSDQKVLISPIRWVKAEPKRLNVDGNRRKATYLMRIPVRVKNNHSVGRLQVEAEASSPGAQEENKVLRLWVVERLQ